MTQIQFRRDTSTNFTSVNPVLASGEPAFETDTGKFKIGNGTTPYNQLEYIGAGDLPDNITTQGNTFNGASQLVQLDSSGKLPAIDGSQLTNLPSSTPSNMVTTDTNQNITGTKTFSNGQIILGSQSSYGISMLQTGSGFTISPTTLIPGDAIDFELGSASHQFGQFDINIAQNTAFRILNNNDTSIQVSKSGVTSHVPLKVNKNNELYEVYDNSLNGTIANLGMPSISAFTDETLPASGTATTATEPGYIYINKTATAVGEYIQVTVSDSSSNVVYSDDKYAVVANQALKLMVPIPNGCSYTVSYTATGTTNNYRFIKTTGQNT